MLNIGKFVKFLIQTGKGVKKMKRKISVLIGAVIAIVLVHGIGFAATTDTVVVSATVAAAARDIIVTPATTLVWSMATATATTHRFISPTMTVSFYGGNQSGGYKIRAYTDNDATVADARGYLVSGANKLYLKAWCPNFGPRNVPNQSSPPPTNRYFWEGYDFNSDGDKSDSGKNSTLTGSYSESTVGFDINGDGDTTDTITVAASTANPDNFTNINYWLGESPSYSWLAADNTLSTYEVVFAQDDTSPLASPFEVRFGADVNGVAGATYAGTITYDIVSR